MVKKEIPEISEIIEPELCKEFRTKFATLPTVVPRQDLQDICTSFREYPYKQMFAELRDVTDKNHRLTLEQKRRIENLLTLVERPSRTLKDLFGQTLPENYEFRIVQPDISTKELGDLFAAVGNCWIRGPQWDIVSKVPSLRTKKMLALEWHKKDMDLGACILAFGGLKTPEGFKPRTQTRLYFAWPKQREPMVYLDTLESGNIEWTDMEEWMSSFRGAELAYSFALPVYIARMYGLDKVILAEREGAQFMSHLRSKELDLFTEPSSRRKIGFPGDIGGEEGPYIYRLALSKRDRVLFVDELLREVDINEVLSRVEDFVAAYKKLPKIPCKVEEVALYVDAIYEMNEAQHKSDEIRTRVARLRASPALEYAK